MARSDGATSPGCGRGRSVRTRTTDDEAPLAVVRQGVLEPGEVLLQETLQRARRARPHPRPRWRLLAQQLQQDLDLGAQVLLAGDDRDGIAAEDLQQFLVLEAEHGLEASCAQNSWFSPPNTSATESSVKMRRIESVSRSATDRTVMLSGEPGRIGIVSVVTIRSNGLAARFSKALPDSTAWVAAAKTRRAPSSLTVSPAARRVPAVSMMSSTITAVLSLTSPITYAISATCWAGRSLLRIASSAPTFSANFLASLTRPASGLTTTRSSSCWSRKYWVRMNIAVMWSTGLEKKPWTWPAWRSIVSTRSAPAASSMCATRRALIGSRGADFLSWRL